MLTRRTLVYSAAAMALAAILSAPAFADPDAALAKLQETVLSKGPSGEDPSPASSVVLTDDELAKIKSMGATAAIVMHYGGNDWSRAQINGLQTQFAAMGIKVIAVTDAGFKPEKQVSDLETIMAQSPNIIVSIPTDPTATASAYRAAAKAGAKLVFMDNVPAGFVPGQDYISVVSADNYGNGVAAAHLMAKALGPDGGEIGLVYHAADFFVTKQRYDAFKAKPSSVQSYPPWCTGVGDHDPTSRSAAKNEIRMMPSNVEEFRLGWFAVRTTPSVARHMTGWRSKSWSVRANRRFPIIPC